MRSAWAAAVCGVAVTAAMVVGGATPATAALPSYSVAETIPAGSAPHGIAVDSSTGLVFVTDQTDDEVDGVGQVSVISAATHTPGRKGQGRPPSGCGHGG